MKINMYGVRLRKCDKGAGKEVPIQACTGPEGSRRLRLPDCKTVAYECGKVAYPAHLQPLRPQEIFPVFISVRSWVDPRAIVRKE